MSGLLESASGALFDGDDGGVQEAADDPSTCTCCGGAGCGCDCNGTGTATCSWTVTIAGLIQDGTLSPPIPAGVLDWTGTFSTPSSQFVTGGKCGVDGYTYYSGSGAIGTTPYTDVAIFQFSTDESPFATFTRTIAGSGHFGAGSVTTVPLFSPATVVPADCTDSETATNLYDGPTGGATAHPNHVYDGTFTMTPVH